MPSPAQSVRNVAGTEDLGPYFEVLTTAFLDRTQVSDDDVDWFLRRYDLGRTWLATDDGHACGTTRTFPSELRLPGGGAVPVSCLCQVAVLPTHTRRGHLSRLMQAQLDAAIASGEVASLLVAAEWPIYGRYGYGPASAAQRWEVDATATGVVGEPVGTWRLSGGADFDEAAAVVLRRQHQRTPGCVDRDDDLRRMLDGVDPHPLRPWKEATVQAVHLDAEGTPDAVVQYETKEVWQDMRPRGTIEVTDLAVVDDTAEREVWRYLLGIDLVHTVVCEQSPPDGVLPHVLTDGRAARLAARWDHLWVRLLDVPAALAARSYLVDDGLVLDVQDPFLDRGGRFALEVGLGEAVCTPTGAAADVTVSVAALGAAWLGGTDLRRLAVAGGVEEHQPGAVERLGRLLRWDRQPFTHTDF